MNNKKEKNSILTSTHTTNPSHPKKVPINLNVSNKKFLFFWKKENIKKTKMVKQKNNILANGHTRKPLHVSTSTRGSMLKECAATATAKHLRLNSLGTANTLLSWNIAEDNVCLVIIK